ncbi:FAD-dependent monooxygenase [Pseudoalteromonas sp. SCSIO 43201]|uniref:NAD(P)/FAD-dependent oxidoreductase n=1 Tax=Pseudoalteromonas sp. SCSIO 43201 TaxID=2822842 RepID=UPI002076335B|nr:NAD(P)/FAD-dependent oxidoreductase [Pseudoalteromonas sp. SCSIO 43201]USD29498.1 FAD-dependent monooxygenase [Pseudoalteromonas sp. SCSIO 43201]
MTKRKSDIVIVGAGIAGCILALALHPHYHVVVIDKQAQAQEKVGECLPPAASRVLRKLHLSHLLQSPEHTTSHGMVSFWGSDYPTIVDNVKNPDGLGWHIHRQHFEQQLRDELARRGISLLSSAKVAGITKADMDWQVQVTSQKSQSELTTQLLIDATGRSCHIARQLGAKLVLSDKQMALWLTAPVATSKQLAVISDETHGWWYSAPSAAYLSQNTGMQTRVFSWQAPAEIIKRSGIADVDGFLTRARQVKGFSTLVDLVNRQGARLHPMVSANSARLERCAADGWFAVGDAGMSFDPLSSQGMLHAMNSSIQLAEILVAHGLRSTRATELYQSQMDRVWARYLEHRQYFYHGTTLA